MQMKEELFKKGDQLWEKNRKSLVVLLQAQIVLITEMMQLLMEITSPYPRENIIAGNYILADMQAYLDKNYRQQNNEIW